MSTVLWVMTGIILQIFPSLAAHSASPFFVFAVVIGGAPPVVTLMIFQETKGLSLEQLHQVCETLCSRTLSG